MGDLIQPLIAALASSGCPARCTAACDRRYVKGSMSDADHLDER
jgi:hypothetical protein